MSSVTRKLAYFDRWVSSVAHEIFAAQPDIDLYRLSADDPDDAVWRVMSTVHGYQILPRGELKEPWFGDARLISRCPNLLAITSTGAGYDMIDVNACTDAGIIVCNQTGSNNIAVAEHAMGLILSLIRNIAVADKAVRTEANLDRFEWTGSDLHGKVVGIVGLGNIGSRVAQLCVAFGTTVIAFDPYLTAEQIFDVHGARKVGFQNLLKQADVISVHCPRSEETMGMFGAPEFSAMKPSAYFVSTARGGIHDEQALAHALREQHIAGAGVDVFLNEPPALDNPLLHIQNVIATPHTAGLSKEALDSMARFAAEQWVSIFNGAVPPRLINPEAWPEYCRRFREIFGLTPACL